MDDDHSTNTGFASILQDVPRCKPLLQAILSLSQHLSNHHQQPPTFIQARATSLSFSLLPSEPSLHEQDRGEDQEDDTHEKNSRRSDPDVLPTLLAYRDGELMKTFVRVDWEAGADGEGLERLLIKWVVMIPVLASSGDGS